MQIPRRAFRPGGLEEAVERGAHGRDHLRVEVPGEVEAPPVSAQMTRNR
jgi:hypothetical protein